MKDTNILINNNVDLDAGLKLFGDIELYNESLVDFLSEVEGKLERMNHFKEQRDTDNYTILVHSLKSDAQYFGFKKLAKMSYQHELEGNKENMLFINENYNDLINEANSIINIVKKYLKSEEQTKETHNDADNLEEVFIAADDSEIIQKIIVRGLDQHKIVSAYNGNEVIDIIESGKYKIKGLLLDLNMPEANGFDVLEYMNINDLFKDIPVSIITGNDEKDINLNAFTYPIVDILQKPFSNDSLIQIVNKMLGFN